MLRAVRRRIKTLRGEPLARLTLRVLAVSPFPEEPQHDENYRPTLLVEMAPELGDSALGAGALCCTTLLLVAWVQERRGDAELPVRLRAIVPRLWVAHEQGQLGPARYPIHRVNQRGRYFLHREAAAYTVELQRDDAGLYVSVASQVERGRWDPDTTLLHAAILAPYEALLRLAPHEQATLLAWLEHAVHRWLDEKEAEFPVTTWDGTTVPAPPDRDG